MHEKHQTDYVAEESHPRRFEKRKAGTSVITFPEETTTNSNPAGIFFQKSQEA